MSRGIMIYSTNVALAVFMRCATADRKCDDNKR